MPRKTIRIEVSVDSALNTETAIAEAAGYVCYGEMTDTLGPTHRRTFESVSTTEGTVTRLRGQEDQTVVELVFEAVTREDDGSSLITELEQMPRVESVETGLDAIFAPSRNH
jgi:hypothetical protein